MAEYPLTNSRKFAKQHDDFEESLNRAHSDGHTLSDAAVEHLKQTDRLDVGYWMAQPENRDVRDKVHNLTDKPKEQVAELDKIAAKLDRDGTYREPGIWLSETDEYLRARKINIKAGVRRR